MVWLTSWFILSIERIVLLIVLLARIAGIVISRRSKAEKLIIIYYKSEKYFKIYFLIYKVKYLVHKLKVSI